MKTYKTIIAVMSLITAITILGCGKCTVDGTQCSEKVYDSATTWAQDATNCNEGRNSEDCCYKIQKELDTWGGSYDCAAVYE